MSAVELIVVAVAVGVAAAVQVLAGFGFSLLAMPIMTLAIPVQRGVVVATILGLAATTWQSWAMRKDADRGLARRLMTGAVLGMPLGLVLLNVTSDRQLRLGLGVAVLIATALLIRRIDLAHTGRIFDFGSGLVSGVLCTSLSTNGPPLVFALQARRVAPAVFRSTISIVFAMSNVIALGLFAADGKMSRTGAVEALVALPSWGLGSAIAWPLRRHVEGERFRGLVLTLLAVAGVLAILAALR